MQQDRGHIAHSLPGGNGAGLELTDGSKIAVMGGGPSGSFFSYFLLGMAEKAGVDLELDVYEPRDYSRPGPPGCNMCGGIVSESLVQNLAAEGIVLPPTVIQRGIDAYVLHTHEGSVRIETPVHEKRIGAVYRGLGPRDLKEGEWQSFDGFLQSLSIERGANIVKDRVVGVGRDNGRPQVTTKTGSSKAYDLLVVAIGVNTRSAGLFENLGLPYKPPGTTQTFIREFYFGAEAMAGTTGSSMHVFLLDIPKLEFAAIIPKGHYMSACLLGDDMDKTVLESFLDSAPVKQCMAPAGKDIVEACRCSPRMNILGAEHPFADRVVFVGDSGITRLYKDGIGAAYRTAKAAAATALFQGISEADFKKHYWPTCRNIEKDNKIGKRVFALTSHVQKRAFIRQAIVRMVVSEQDKEGHQRHMSTVLWDMFTGSAPYREILRRAFRPAFLARLLGSMVLSIANGQRGGASGVLHDRN